ncbi:unnamed protein product [Fraxinus pennsylvanica]|uniref:Receptor-like protein kinase n=1 Tax=Fraxinus pennsylvanica TaxID=56036 RepID=A0AAD2A026_9LAMI|nr:unnamed protein product [Fraxinus pennsylvanica]
MSTASFLVLLSIFHLIILNFVNSKCQESFQCGSLGVLEFPINNYSQPECGFLGVDCNASSPKLYLANEELSQSYIILSKISTNVFLIRNPTLLGCTKNNSEKLKRYFQGFKNYSGCESFDVYYTDRNLLSTPDGCSAVPVPTYSRYDVNSMNFWDLFTDEYELEWHLSEDCNCCHNRGGDCTTNIRNQFKCQRGITST